MSLEERSGAKTLLKLLLDKTFDVLEQAQSNEVKLNELSVQIDAIQTELKILNKSTDDITGNHYEEQDII